MDGASLVKCSEKRRTLQEDTFSERGTDDLDLDVRPRQEPKTNQNQIQEPQTDVLNSDDISLLSTTNATADESHTTPTMCAQSATPTNMWLQMWQGPKKEGTHLTMHNRSTMTSRPGG